MFGSEILEVAVGVGFLYLLLSLMCSAITEGIARAFAMRSETLRSGIRNLLGDPDGKGLAKDFYDHPLIKGLYRQGWFDRMIGREGKPSYISPRTFVLALFDTLVSTDPVPDNRDYAGVRGKIGKIQQNDDFKRALLVCMDDAEKDLGRARENVERWFGEAMERVTGWYRRKMQLIIIVVAAVVSVVLNVDSFSVTNALWNDAARLGRRGGPEGHGPGARWRPRPHREAVERTRSPAWLERSPRWPRGVARKGRRAAVHDRGPVLGSTVLVRPVEQVHGGRFLGAIP